MSPFLRMKRLYPWRPLVKKSPVEPDRHRQRRPQYDGSPGWMLLTHDEDGIAQAIFVDKNDKPHTVQIVLDERVFSDTVLRVVRLPKDVYVVYDVKTLNGVHVFETLNYEQRQEKLSALLDLFHHPDLAALILPEDVPAGTLLRGYEHYDDKPGTLGAFLPAVE
jgi:hypothetical protein